MSTNSLPEGHELQVDALLADLKSFLMTPDHGDGSWPQISEADHDALYQLAARAADLKWGRDCDNDSPVRWSLLNRREAYWVWSTPLRHAPTQESWEDAEMRLLDNLRSISGALSCYGESLRSTHTSLDALRREKLEAQASFPVWVVAYRPTTDWASANPRDQPASLHVSADEAEGAAQRFAAEGFVKREVIQYWAVPDIRWNPAADLAAYQARLKDVSDRIQPQYGVLSKLRLKSADPRNACPRLR